MSQKMKPKKAMGQWHVAVAAEAVAASLFARCGYDVSVQYGADQPGYDLVVVRDDLMAKISVKGSQDGGWGLTQSHLKAGAADYHNAIDRWAARQHRDTLFCFVQFQTVELSAMPRVYLATRDEVADRLKRSAKGRGETVLYERKVWTARAQASGTTDEIPVSWKFSRDRVNELLRMAWRKTTTAAHHMSS